MLHSINKEENKKYTFITKSNWTDKIEVLPDGLLFTNDVYTKQTAIINDLDGELIICSDINKLDGFCKKVEYETYQEYKKIISNRDWSKEQWVYNILDGIAEQDKILYQDDRILIAPNYTWAKTGDDNNLSKMYLLVFPMDRKLHTLRDLNFAHIELLEYIKNKTLDVIKEKYGFDSNIIKMFIHYAPSTYHLHIHFVSVSNTDVNSSIEYSHDLDSVINILKIKSDYYQSVDIDIKKRI
jgi:diadenosine tetraphosphate (Ap4A) HIT family hydrolase